MPKLLVAIIVLWLAGFAFLAGAWVGAAFVAIPGLAALCLAARAALRGRPGAMAAWATASLAPLGVLDIFALANVHLHDFTGVGSGCDFMSQNCNPQPIQGALHAAALCAFLVAGILTLRLNCRGGEGGRVS